MAADISQYVAQFGRANPGASGTGIGYAIQNLNRMDRNRMADLERQDRTERRNRQEQREFARQGAEALLSADDPNQRQNIFQGWRNEGMRRGYDMEGIPDQYNDEFAYQLAGKAGVALPGAQEQGGPRFGTINPRDYTPESLAQYQQSGDFRDLERFANQQFKMIRGADGRERLHTLDPASGQYVLARGNIVDGELQPPAGGAPAPQEPVSTTTGRTPEEEAAAVTRAKEEAKQDISRESAQPKARSAALSARPKVERLTKLIDRVIPRVSAWTAGPGATLANLPATDARDLRADIDTIKANMGFSELQQMRDNSPTGGALGQVTEREIAFLQSLVANLEQDQSPAQLRRNLEIVRREVQNSWQRVSDAYEQQYGEPLVAESGGDQGDQQQAGAVNWSDL